MPLAEFRNCWSCIQRSETHKQKFAAEWNSLLTNESYSPILSMDDDGAEPVHAESTYDLFPEMFALELVEILYQFRGCWIPASMPPRFWRADRSPSPHEDRLEFPISVNPQKSRKSA
jgi:hypothetical protein